MIVVKLLAPVLILAASLIQLALQLKWGRSHDARTTLHRRIRTVLIVLMVGFTVLTCIVVWRDNAASEHLSSQLDKLDSDNQNLKRQLEQSTLQITALGEANAKLTSEVAKSVTGGDSFCYFRFGNWGGSPPFTVVRNLMHVGPYPLYDLHIRITDVNQVKAKAKEWANMNFQQQTTLGDTFIVKPNFFGDGQANFLEDLSFIHLPKDQVYQQYSIFFTARNGEWRQLVSLRRDQNGWQSASRVSHYSEDKDVQLMPDQVSPGFPRDANGNLLW